MSSSWHSELSPAAKRVLVEQMLRQRAGQPKLYPASDPQRRLWFFDQLEPGSAVYNNCMVLDLVGAVDVAALEGALSTIVARHDSLRTTFTVVDGAPEQLIAPAGVVALERADLSGEPASTREGELERRLDEEARRPFDLTRGPLLRALWIRTGADTSVFALTIHHIVSDGWSLLLLLRELATSYADCLARRPSSLPPLPLQYGEHALWQQDRLSGAALAAQLSFWRSVLGNDVSPLELPADAPRPRVQGFRGRSLSVSLPGELAAALRGFSRRHDVTLFMTLLAAFGVLLGRLAGREAVTVGTPIAGRTRAEVEGLVGFFVNTLPMRVDLSDDPSFEQLVGRVGRMAKQAYAHQEVPFDRLVDELHVERDLSRTPLFQVLLNMLNFPAQTSFELPGLRLGLRSLPQTASKFDLTLYVAGQGEGLTLSSTYNADLFGERRMGELLAQFVSLLEQLARRPDAPVSGHSLVTPDARAVLPDPGRALASPEQAALPGLLALRAREARERIALREGAHNWTYGELEARASRLAHRLLSAGLRRGQVVAVHARRDPLLVCSLLAIHKAGGAFAILDPAYPPARLSACWRAASPCGLIEIEGAGEPAAVLEPELRQLQPKLRLRLSTALLDEPHASFPAEDPGLDLRSDDAAYVAFTSGTTGGVKAVLGTHGPLAHFVDWHARTFSLGPDDRFALLSGLSHDPLLRDILTPLWLGATLCVPDPDQMGDPRWLAGWLADEGVTVAHLTPASSELVATGRGPDGSRIDRLRWAFFGGDVLTRGTVQRLRESAPNVTCVNFYGATETPQAMGFHVVSAPADRAPDPSERIPVGRGIDGVELLVLARPGLLAGIGELGEIAVRTHHLAQGYVGDEALTRARFVRSPFTDAPDDRLYLTGDLGRYGLDGTVEFAGRADTQVKIRGFRVELGEIEAALREHPGVDGAVVVAQDTAPGERRLVAYVVRTAAPGPAAGGGSVESGSVALVAFDSREPAGAGGPDVAGLRQHVSSRVPTYMVPSAFVFLDALPLTPNGKVDRRALPAPPPEAGHALAAHVAPRTPTETTVARIWGEILSLPRPAGVDVSFFDLGGHSLSAARLVSALGSAFGVDVPLRLLFERPTIARLSEAVDLLLASHRARAEPISGDREEFEF